MPPLEHGLFLDQLHDLINLCRTFVSNNWCGEFVDELLRVLMVAHAAFVIFSEAINKAPFVINMLARHGDNRQATS